MSAEEWRPIPGWEGLYEASDAGNIRSLDRVVTGPSGRRSNYKGRSLRPGTDGNGYLAVNLCRLGTVTHRAVHQIVALTFLGPAPVGLEVCHCDGDRFNNSARNLRYDTRSANAYDSVKHGTHPAVAKASRRAVA